MNSVASVKDRLKNKSRETGRTLQEMFTLYGLERTIYRISISPYKENFPFLWNTKIFWNRKIMKKYVRNANIIYSGMGFLFTADPLFRSRRGRFAAAEKPGDLGQRSYFG